MKFVGFGRILKKQRIEKFRKTLLKNSSYFIDQLNNKEIQNHVRKDMKEVFFYPTQLDTTTDIKQNKLLLILSTDNFFLCNGETVTDNKKVIDYQVKLKTIDDHFYKECYSRNADYEIRANTVYAEISSVLSSAKCASNKHFRVSPFFNFWHNSLVDDHWQVTLCQLETDDFVYVKYGLQKKKHKNYCFNPCLLFGASKENIQIGIDADECYYYCWLKMALVIDQLTTQPQQQQHTGITAS